MKDYTTGKHEEELQNVPPSAIGWRVALSCDLFPETGGELVRVNVYHSRDNRNTYQLVRSATFAAEKVFNKDGTPATEVWIGGEYPFEHDGKDANDKDKVKYIKASDFKIEIDAKKDFQATMTVEAVDEKDAKAKLFIDPERLLGK